MNCVNSTDGPIAASVEGRHLIQAKSDVTGHRLKTLDGMRGVTALLVVIYHFFGRWAVPEHETTLYPHGNLLDHLPFVAVFRTVGIFD